MVNKNLLNIFVVFFVSGAAFIANNSPTQALTTKLQKRTSFQQETSQYIEVEKSQVQAQPLYIAQSVSSGRASWYGPGFHGRRTANGEVFNQNALTAAHRSLPFGTRVRVTNVNNGRSVVVRINDRGPFKGGRVIDLSAAAAHNLGMVHHGVVTVRLEVLR